MPLTKTITPTKTGTTGSFKSSNLNYHIEQQCSYLKIWPEKYKMVLSHLELFGCFSVSTISISDEY